MKSIHLVVEVNTDGHITRLIKGYTDEHRALEHAKAYADDNELHLFRDVEVFEIEAEIVEIPKYKLN